MNWQLIAVIVTVAAAASYLFWSVWRSVKGGSTGCKGGCKCPSERVSGENGSAHISIADLGLRQRNNHPA